MPRPRKYESNAARQAAYRKRLKAGTVVTQKSTGTEAVTRRVLASEARASE